MIEMINYVECYRNVYTRSSSYKTGIHKQDKIDPSCNNQNTV